MVHLPLDVRFKLESRERMNNNIVSLPNDADSYYKLAHKKINQQSFHEAIPYLKKAIEHRADDQYIIELAHCFLEVGEMEKAEHLLFDRIIIQEDFDEYFYELSQLYIKQREPNKAFLYGLYYVQLTGDNDYLNELTEMFEVVYKDQQAVEAESALFVTQQLFQYLFSHGRINESLDWMNSQPLSLQNRKEMRNLKAMAYLFVGKYQESEVLLEQLLSEDETDIHALCHYTLLLYNTQRHHEYLHYLQRLNKLHPINEDESFKLGIVLSFLKQHEASQQLLYPIYKKGKMNNAQLLHALSFNFFALGDEALSDELWKKLVKLTGTAAPPPKAMHRAAVYVEERIMPMMRSDDSHERLLSIFLLSKVPYKETVLTKELWDELEQLGDYEKLYLSYIFHQLELVKLNFIHEGLELLYPQPVTDEYLLGWIDMAESIIASEGDLTQVSAYAAVSFYRHKRTQEKVTKAEVMRRFDVTPYYFYKAETFCKQNNI